MVSNLKQVIEKILGRKLSREEYLHKFASLTVKEAIEKARKLAKEKRKIIIHGREFWLTYKEMKEALGIEDEKTARKIWESAKSKTYCNPPEDCKRCAYAPQGSELCKADYVVWIIENKTDKVSKSSK